MWREPFMLGVSSIHRIRTDLFHLQVPWQEKVIRDLVQQVANMDASLLGLIQEGDKQHMVGQVLVRDHSHGGCAVAEHIY